MRNLTILEFNEICLGNYILRDESNDKVCLVIRDLKNFKSSTWTIATIYHFSIFRKNSNLLGFYRLPIVKGDKLRNEECLKNDLENDAMKTIPCARVVGSLMYVQVCTRPDIAFIVNVLGRYLLNHGHDHWVAAKKVMRYLQRTKDFMLIYRRVDNLEVVGYSNSDFGGCSDDRKSTSRYIFMLVGGAISWKSVK